MPNSPSPSSSKENKKPAPALVAKGKKRQLREKSQGKKRSFKIPYPYFHLAVGLLGTGGLIFGLFFVSQKLSLWSTQLEQDKSQLAALEEASLDQQSLEQQYQSVAGAVEVIERAFPNEETIVDFFKMFSRLGRGVNVESFDFETDQPLADAQGQAYISFGFEVVGEAARVEEFLEHVHQLPYLIDYDLVDLNYIHQNEVRLVIRARLGVANNFYLQKNE